jgi:hypothetical protein
LKGILYAVRIGIGWNRLPTAVRRLGRDVLAAVDVCVRVSVQSQVRRDVYRDDRRWRSRHRRDAGMPALKGDVG